MSQLISGVLLAIVYSMLYLNNVSASSSNSEPEVPTIEEQRTDVQVECILKYVDVNTTKVLDAAVDDFCERKALLTIPDDTLSKGDE